MSFAVIGDIHLGAHDKSEAYLIQALEEAKKRRVDFVVLIGDLTEGGKLERFAQLKKIVDELGLKYFIVAGNHDVGKESEQQNPKNFNQTFGDVFSERLITLNQKGTIKQIRLFLLNTSMWRGGENTLLGTNQWQWLQKKSTQLTFDPSEIRLVFSQSPFERLSTTDSHYLRQFICENFIDAFISADLHKTERILRKCPVPLYNEKMEDITFNFHTFKAGALFKPQGEFPGFLILHLFENRFIESERVLVGID